MLSTLLDHFNTQRPMKSRVIILCSFIFMVLQQSCISHAPVAMSKCKTISKVCNQKQIGSLKGNERLIKNFKYDPENELILRNALIKGKISVSREKQFNYPWWYLGVRLKEYSNQVEIIMDGKKFPIYISSLSIDSVRPADTEYLQLCDGWDVELAGTLGPVKLRVDDLYYLKTKK